MSPHNAFKVNQCVNHNYLQQLQTLAEGYVLYIVYYTVKGELTSAIA